jgi:DNA-binding PadR family transcriptional regulator
MKTMLLQLQRPSKKNIGKSSQVHSKRNPTRNTPLQTNQHAKLLLQEQERVAKQLLDSQVLHLLRIEPQSLYSLRNSLLNTFGVERSFGTIHPHLARLESSGLIKGYYVKVSNEGFHKIVYRLTKDGEETLQRNAALIRRMGRKISSA